MWCCHNILGMCEGMCEACTYMDSLGGTLLIESSLADTILSFTFPVT